jgi:hypothetical protein
MNAGRFFVAMNSDALASNRTLRRERDHCHKPRYDATRQRRHDAPSRCEVVQISRRQRRVFLQAWDNRNTKAVAAIAQLQPC